MAIEIVDLLKMVDFSICGSLPEDRTHVPGET